MTVALKKVLRQISRMPLTEQDVLADLLKEELSWQKSFSKSQKQLEFLAAEALVEFKKGKTRPFNLK